MATINNILHNQLQPDSNCRSIWSKFLVVVAKNLSYHATRNQVVSGLLLILLLLVWSLSMLTPLLDYNPPLPLLLLNRNLSLLSAESFTAAAVLSFFDSTTRPANTNGRNSLTNNGIASYFLLHALHCTRSCPDRWLTRLKNRPPQDGWTCLECNDLLSFIACHSSIVTSSDNNRRKCNFLVFFSCGGE